MFASLFRRDSSRPLGPNAYRTLSTKSRPTPRLPTQAFLPEIELDRRLSYWAMTRAEPGTATLRINLFENHLRVTLDTDANLDRSLKQIAAADPSLVYKAAGLRTILAEQIMAALHDVGRPLAQPGRLAVVIKALTTNLAARFDAITNIEIANMIDYVGIANIIDLTKRALREVSQEQQVAGQLKQTAKTVRKLEELLAHAMLPDEDLFELKLRRDLFMADLRVFSRLTKTAMGT
jgi:hypothetical protein